MPPTARRGVFAEGQSPALITTRGREIGEEPLSAGGAGTFDARAVRATLVGRAAHDLPPAGTRSAIGFIRRTDHVLFNLRANIHIEPARPSSGSGRASRGIAR